MTYIRSRHIEALIAGVVVGLLGLLVMWVISGGKSFTEAGGGEAVFWSFMALFTSGVIVHATSFGYDE